MPPEKEILSMALSSKLEISIQKSKFESRKHQDRTKEHQSEHFLYFEENV
jgi:hypothetical protein